MLVLLTFWLNYFPQILILYVQRGSFPDLLGEEKNPMELQLECLEWLAKRGSQNPMCDLRHL